jgi:hypothetical protein
MHIFSCAVEIVARYDASRKTRDRLLSFIVIPVSEENFDWEGWGAMLDY